MTSSKIGDNPNYVFAANVSDIQAADGCLSVQIQKYTIALFYYNFKIHAVDNRCPHMGFPLSRGTVKDSILTCHWHHARFDLTSGGTFDQWAGDVRSFPLEIRNGNEVWIDISSSSLDPLSYHQKLLENGLKQNISLMIAKVIIAMLGEERKDNDVDKADKEDNDNKRYSGITKAFVTGLDFGTHYKQSGWGQGLTILSCMMNILHYLDIKDRSHALYHGISAVAQDCASMPPRFKVSSLPSSWLDLPTLKRWFRQFIESRDAQAAEKCIVTAVRIGADSCQMADMLFAAATDHRYLDIGHVLDFTNKALEALDIAGWDNKELVESVLSSLVYGYANAERMEESSSWRHPVDLIAILEYAFRDLPSVLENGRYKRTRGEKWNGKDQLVKVLLSDDPQSISNELLNALKQGASEEVLASTVAYAAVLRIAQFHTRNEFGDWDTALHTFTYTNAVHQGLRRVATQELLRGVFDGAMRVYLNRFLNVPAVPLPTPTTIENNNSDSTFKDPEKLLKEFPLVLDKQQQVNQAGQLVIDYLYNDGNPDRLLAAMGNVLLREDRNFHSIQMIEAGFRQYSLLAVQDTDERTNILIAIARYLASHSPTMRVQERTYQIANQLYQGERLFEDQQ
jgi:nitrite reductase/ring-hydroxylating ferredoxin subunit